MPKLGFSLVELILVIALVGAMMIFVTRFFWLRDPDAPRKQFVVDLNGLVQSCWSDALETGKLHRVYFDLKKKQIRAEIEVEKSKKEGGESKFNIQQGGKSLITWPSNYVIKDFFVSDQNESKNIDKLESIFFYITSDGTQDVIINVANEEDGMTMGLVLNPFAMQFKDYGNFKKP
ncbi:MAG: hypothetical protein UR26_C0001G0092 [candidate division TM6 bacterium GW2011_GWF2_32_72]|nr:MAG: hypothetical protein UR26_C0001G0092 [candidate division TM6 bacterium GW2011_GWF2_32_72]